ncbi:caspase domain-containing protein [Actinoplanes sp. NPDC020271]|uniref:caspase domain-containing protein n=1 Tax=Actinoplanes sp. NPDC020271 TaxID=3363896 RepID=UPI0037A64721
MGAVFALLAGIDTYASETVPDLRGCRNDALAAAAYLRTRSAAARVLRLFDRDATRSAIIDGIHRHLGQARRGDTALFWFSGHGSQVRVPDGLQHLETGPMMQTLVCSDSRTAGVPDLLDKELSLLLDEVAGRGAHVAVVLDSCHSEGASRLTARVRSARPILQAARPRPPVLLPELGGRPYDAVGRSGARHVALAAARRTELARELELDGEPRGVFSWALLRALGRLGGAATYRALLTAARVDVEARIAEQVPQLYPIEPGLADQPFLGGATGSPAGMSIRHGRDGWELDAGACHGLPVTGEELRVARTGGGEPREARVTRVLTERSLVTPLGWTPDPDRQYPMVFSRVPSPATTVAGVPPEEIEKSAFVRPAAPGEEPELLALGGTRIRTPDGEVPPGPGTRRQRLEHVARWRQIRALENPQSRLAGAVALEVIPKAPGNPPINGEITLAYERGAPPHIYIRMYNRTNRPLYCVLLDLTSGYRVDTQLFAGAFVDARAAGWALSRDPVKVTVPERSGGVTRDWLKLLVAEEQFSSMPFALPGIDQIGEEAHRSIRLRGPHCREDGESAYDWTTVTIPIVTRARQ